MQNVRIIIPWAGVQPFNRDLYYWANVDRMVNAAAARNMGVLAVLNSTPAWASDRYLSGHPDPDVFAEFAGLAADRYKGKISAYEVWNEPNGITFWNPVDPVAYTRMLQVSYTAIKSADPSAVVVGGVVVSLFNAGQVTMNPEDFVEQMYAAGAKGSFDAISFHPYNFDGKFGDGEGKPLSALEQVEAIRRLMEENGDGDLKIWATEYGIPTAELRPGYVVTEEQQAEFIDDFLHAWQDVDGAGPMFIYSTRDTSTGDLDISKNYGFFYTDWTPKLAAKVIAEFAGGLLPPAAPDRPILDAAVAIARAIINATERVIQAGVKLFGAVVDITVQVIKTLVDVGVRVVKGLANATVAVISGVVDAIGRIIDAIGDRVGPDASMTAAKSAQRVPATAALASAQPTSNDTTLARKNRGTTEAGVVASAAVTEGQVKSDVAGEPAIASPSVSEPKSGAVVSDTKTAAAEQDNDADDPETTGTTDTTSDTADKSTAKVDATGSPKGDTDEASAADTTKPSNGSDSGESDKQDTKDVKKN